MHFWNLFTVNTLCYYPKQIIKNDELDCFTMHYTFYEYYLPYTYETFPYKLFNSWITPSCEEVFNNYYINNILYKHLDEEYNFNNLFDKNGNLANPIIKTKFKFDD